MYGSAHVCNTYYVYTKIDSNKENAHFCWDSSEVEKWLRLKWHSFMIKSFFFWHLSPQTEKTRKQLSKTMYHCASYIVVVGYKFYVYLSLNGFTAHIREWAIRRFLFVFNIIFWSRKCIDTSENSFNANRPSILSKSTCIQRAIYILCPFDTTFTLHKSFNCHISSMHFVCMRARKWK